MRGSGNEMKWRAIVKVCGVAALLVAGPVAAEPVEDGYTAYKRGEHAEAMKIWRPLAEQGHSWAQLLLGLMHDWGMGVPKDKAEAQIWYRQAIDLCQYYFNASKQGVCRDREQTFPSHRCGSDC